MFKLKKFNLTLNFIHSLEIKSDMAAIKAARIIIIKMLTINKCFVMWNESHV